MTAALALLAGLAVPPGPDLALIGPAGVTTVRIALDLDGRPAEAVWAAAHAALFAYFDRNGDNRLDRAEAARLPAAVGLRQVAWGHPVPAPGGGPTWDEVDADRDGAVTPAEVRAYYQPRGVGGVVVAACRPASTAKLDVALRRLLDADGDGAVSPAELAAAPARLAPLDANADDLVSAAELVPGVRYPGGSPAALVSPTREPKRGGSSVAPLDGPPRTPARVWRRPSGAGGARSVVGGGRWEVCVDPAPPPADRAAGVRRTFRECDANGDGALDGVERERPAALGLKGLQYIADRDGDGRLSAAELDGWLALTGEVSVAVVVVGVWDLGRGLFEQLDADRDGHLSVRELRAARVGGSDGPSVSVVVVGRGRVPSGWPPPLRGGPAWFRAADRNGDGDVSAAEFPGPADTFRRLDADGDGLLAPAEAATAGDPGRTDRPGRTVPPVPARP